jgi:type II secretory pathway component GspD/PulD (secretin)
MMDVSPIVTKVSSVSTILDSRGNIQSSAPNLDIRQSTSLVRAQSGETIVIGGLIQDQESETERSIPILGNIPWIGHLFKGTYKVKHKKELVIFLTAKVVNSTIRNNVAARSN